MIVGIDLNPARGQPLALLLELLDEAGEVHGDRFPCPLHRRLVAGEEPTVLLHHGWTDLALGTFGLGCRRGGCLGALWLLRRRCRARRAVTLGRESPPRGGLHRQVRSKLSETATLDR